MKKIKYLLLFWILILLWIGSSFWYIYTNYQFEFKSNNNNNILFNINPWNSNISSYLMSYQDSGWTRNSVNILRRSSTSSTNLFNISSYSVSSFTSYSYNTAKLYSSSSCLDLSVTGSSYQLLFHLFWSNNCNSTSNSTISSREVYVNVWDSCINSVVVNTWNCDYWFYKYFGFNWTFDSRFDSLIQDNQYSWSNAWKTSISFPFPDSYSFFNSIAWSWTWPYELPSVYIYNQKYIYHTWDSFSAINWLYITRINDLNSTFENSDFQVIVLDLTWVFSDWDLSNNYFIYWIFNCPYSAQDILDCSFNDWWTISNLYTANSITWNVLQFLTTRDWFSAGSTYNYFSNFLRNKLSTDWTLTFYRFLAPNNAYTSQNAPNWISTSVQLVSDWNNYFQDLFPWWNWWNWSQSTWSIPLSSLYYQCLGPTYNTLDWNPPVWCLNPDWSLINVNDYKDCFFTINSDWSLSQSFYCSIWNITQEMDWIQSWSGWYFAPCSWDDCSVDFIIGQSYINLDPVNTVTTWLVLDMITNLTWRVGRCPFPYVDFWFWNSFKVFNYFKSLWYNIDPFIPFNCAIAWFHAGRYTIFEDLELTIFDIPILNWDTEKHKILFRFFDVLIIFAIFWIYRFFRKHI